MLVYDDQERVVDLDAVWNDLRERWAVQRTRPTIDGLRALLIASGALEQAAEDAFAEDDRCHPFVARVRATTDAAARAFHAAWVRQSARIPDLPEDTPLAHTTATMRVPEGYMCYALFPEQYCASALRWAAATRTPEDLSRPALVIGIRSIGTSLSAVVAASLSAAGVPCERITVRLGGPPFDRRLELDDTLVRKRAAILVVDEGPGLSGSSMAAVVTELSRHNVAHSAVAFIAAHERGPGVHATDTVRRIWNDVPCYATPVSAPIFAGRSLPQQLAQAMATRIAGEAVALPDEDWRAHGHARREDWRPMTARFVSPRYRVRMGHQLVAFEFAGLSALTGASDSLLEAAFRAARGGHAPAPFGEVMGFVARPWIVGTSPRSGDATRGMLVRLTRYLGSMAGEPLGEAELEAAHERRLRWTLANLPGRDRSELEAALAALPVLGPPWNRRASDCDPAPQRWTRMAGRPLQRNGTIGRAHPHTIVGPQPVLWDIAALICEWQLDAPAARLVITTVEEQLGATISPRTLRAFMLAFLAFQIGVLSLCMGDDDDERPRLARAIAAYEARVDRVLSTSDLR